MTLFPDDKVVGTFYGFTEGGLSPSAALIFRHNPTFQSSPVNGMPVLVRLDSDDEALLVRITRLVPTGRLATAIGEEYAMHNLRDRNYQMPENVLDSFLSYRVEARPLGLMRRAGDKTFFVPSHRRIPPFGAPVAFPDDGLFRLIMCASPDDAGVEIGFAALGEFVWGSGDPRFTADTWMSPQTPVTCPRFDIHHLIARRTFVLAKAGYGKSNLVKFLFSELYRTTPTRERDNGTSVPVGTLIGDLDGEYFWPDAHGIPGLADVTHLHDQLVVFTNKQPPSAAYGSFVAGPVRLDIRQLKASKVLSLTVAPERSGQRNVERIMSLKDDEWGQLVDVVDNITNRPWAEVNAHIAGILRLDPHKDDKEIGAARANVMNAINKLHDPNSPTLDLLMTALKRGKLCVVDLSGLRGAAQSFLALILDRLFHHNMAEHTSADSQAIPLIGVIEEAQNVLNNKVQTNSTKPFLEFTKEGRKFDCSVMAITQQPGSIDDEIISQGDNFFAFHLLSEPDLKALKRANAHFSDDILASLLNEPIVGSGYFWSGHSEKKYPVPFRPFDFRTIYGGSLLDSPRTGDVIETYAARLREEGTKIREERDKDADDKARAIEALLHNATFQRDVRGRGIKWGVVHGMLAEAAPQSIRERDGGTDGFDRPSMQWAKPLVPKALNEILGPQGIGWKRDDEPPGYIHALSGAKPDPGTEQSQPGKAKPVITRSQVVGPPEGSDLSPGSNVNTGLFDDEPPF